MKYQENQRETQKKYEYSYVNLVPSMVLFHRANYIHDKAHAFGKVIIVEIMDELIICETKIGIKTFARSDLGRYLFFDEESASKVELINGPKHIPNEESKLYVRKVNDEVFYYENDIFDRLVNKIKNFHSIVSDKININKQGYSHVQEVHVSSQRNELQELREQEERYKDIISSPYFAKLELGKYASSQVYIGNRGVPESDNQVLDWREPVAQLYYTKNPIEYKKYDLKCIRKFDIYGGSFCGYYDSYQKDLESDNSGIIDDFFLSVIKQKREDKELQDIIQTLQDKQFEIVSLPSELNIRVQGCAGSGKTMIMMHRISHILFNNKEVNVNNIIVITPNKQLNLELSTVAKKLDLDQISRNTIQDFYIDLIEKYMKKNKISTSSKYFLKLKTYNEKSSSNIMLNNLTNYDSTEFSERFIEYLRSFKEYETIFQYSNVFTSDSLKFVNKQEFIKDFQEKTTRLTTIVEKANRQDLLGKNVDIEKIKTQIRNRIDRAYGEFHKQLRKHGFIEQETNLRLNEVINFRLSFEQSNELRDVTIKKITNSRNIIIEQSKKIEKIEQLIKEIRSYLEELIFTRYEELTIHEITLSLNDLTSHKMLRYLYYFSLEYKKVSYLEKYIKGSNNSYIIAAWESYLNEWKHGNSMVDDDIYSFEYYELLRMMHRSFACLSSEKEWLFIDEGQDYSSSFIEIIKDVYPNAIINIFGDINQRLTNNYNSYFFDSCERDSKFTLYEVNTNYRNCVEITSHINEKCDMNMTPIGLHGSLTTYNQISKHKIPWDKYKGRNIIIVQNESSYVKLLSNLPSNLTDKIRYNNFTFSDKHINVMSISSVKGLEFEEIMVYNNEMNQNDYYVACSRALNDLSILV